MMKRISLLTDSRYTNPTDPPLLVQQVLDEEALLMDALEKRGCRVDRVSWDDKHIKWADRDLCVIRSTWDYQDRMEDFLPWLDRIEKQTSLCNPADMVRWNLDKNYLSDLEKKGIRIPPSRFIRKGENRSLAEHLEGCGWKEAVLKPVVSAGAKHTYRFRMDEADVLEPTFHILVEDEAMMLQEFMPSVLDQGELSLVMIGGRFSHAVRKNPNPGDYRVQDDFGGSFSLSEADTETIDFARSVLEACGGNPAYARVDILRDEQGQALLSEVELIEPELWFRLHPQGAEELAEVLLQEL